MNTVGVILLCSIHPGFDVLGGDFVLLDDVDDGTPTRGGITVESVDEGLRDALEQLVRTHLRFPQRFAHT